MRGPIKIDDAPFSKEWITKVKSDSDGTVSHIIFVHKDDGKTRKSVPITNSKDLQTAEEQALMQKRTVGYQMRATCMATSLDGEISIKSVAEIIRKLSTWEITIHDGEQRFDVSFGFDGEDKSLGHQFLDDLEDILVAVSLENRIQISTSLVNWGPYSIGQPFSAYAGKPTQVMRPVTKDDVVTVKELRQQPELDSIIHKLLNYYGQTTITSRIVEGFSVMEELAKSVPTRHILDDHEKSLVKDAIDELTFKSDDEKKKKKLKEAIGRDALLFEKSRNERIAIFFTEIMPDNLSTIDKAVKQVARARGELAHKTVEDVENAKEVAEFIERCILAYLDHIKKPPTP